MRTLTEVQLTPAQQDAIDAIMKEGLASVFPAAVLLIHQRGMTLFQRSYGWLDPVQKRWPTQEDTLFDLASLTKLFTTTAFLTLVSAGRVSLDTPVAEVVPEFRSVHPIQPGIDPHAKTLLPPDPNYQGKRVDAGRVRFRHLLTHTSGLAAWEDLCGREGKEAAIFPHRLPPEARQRRLDAFLRAPRFVYPPGERILYSDLGFILLGEAIERLTGQRLPEYLAQAVCEPLGLARTFFNPLARGTPRERMAPTEFCAWRGRRLWGEVHDENAACLGGVAGHAGLFATARDVAALGRCYLDDGGGILAPALAAEAVSEQVRDETQRRGLGWQLMSPQGSPVGGNFGPSSFGHTGFTGVSMWIDPHRELIVALLTNRVYHGRDGEAISRFRVRLHEAIASIVDDHSETMP